MEKGKYSEEDKKFMYITGKSLNASRMEELLNFIRLSGFKKIGIANCFSVNKIAEKLKEMLLLQGLDVYMVNCKESGLMAADISPELQGASCDPMAQAQYLNEAETDLNINFGLCLGHGLLFQKYSAAPVTTLLVKDPRHKHNIMENFV